MLATREDTVRPRKFAENDDEIASVPLNKIKPQLMKETNVFVSTLDYVAPTTGSCLATFY